MVSRREFLFCLGSTSLAASVGGVVCKSSMFPALRVESLTLPYSGLPEELKGFKIGFLSDLHLGAFVPASWVEHSLHLLQQAKVDVLLLGGDYIGFRDSLKAREFGFCIEGSPESCPAPVLANRLFTQASQILSSVQFPDGTYGVSGNHERYVPLSSRIATFKKYGLTTLHNDTATIVRGRARIKLIGVDDLWYGHPRLPKIPDKTPENEFRVLLSHNPDFFSLLAQRRPIEFNLGLAGHTHGGQIKFPLVGALEYNVRDQRFREGLRTVNQTHIYTSRGLGVVKLPWRLNCPPEVSVFELQAA